MAGVKGARERTQDFDTCRLRQALIWLVALKIAGIILIFDVRGLQAFDVPKSIFSRGVEWLLVALLAVALLRYGTAIVPRTALHLAVGAVAATTLLAALFAEQPFVALYGHHESYLGLTFLADMIVLYLTVAIAFRRGDDWLVVLAAAGAAAALAVLYAVIQHLGLDPIRWREDPRDRPFSTFGHPDHFGHFLSLAFGAAVGLAATAHGRGGSALRVFALVLAAGLAWAAAATGTRGTLLGVGAALAALPLVVLRLRGLSTRLVAGVAAGGVLALVAFGAAMAFTPVGERLEGAGAAPTRDRLFLYESALRAFAERPVLGRGPDGFAVAYPQYRQAEAVRQLGPGRPQVSAHNWVLQAAVNGGAVGLIALLGLVAVGTLALWRSLGRAPAVAAPLLLAWLAYWSHSLVAVGTIAVDWLPWVALGGAASLQGTRRETALVRHRLAPALAAALLIPAALGGALSGTFALQANQAAWEARASWREGDPARATVAAAAAVRLDAGRADHWNWLGLAQELAGDERSAGAAFAEAASRAPHVATYWRNLARALARGGDEEGALHAAGRAVEVDPHDPFARQVLAETATAFGRCDLGLEHAFVAFRLYRQGRGISLALADAATCAADPLHARAVLQDALAVGDSGNVHLGLARIGLRLGDVEAARHHAMRALQIDPGSREARQILSQTRQ